MADGLGPTGCDSGSRLEATGEHRVNPGWCGRDGEGLTLYTGFCVMRQLPPTPDLDGGINWSIRHLLDLQPHLIVNKNQGGNWHDHQHDFR